MIYLDYASIGIPDSNNLNQMTRKLKKLPDDISSLGSDATLNLLAIWEHTREKIASFYGVKSRNISFIQNTTEGLGIIAASLMNNNAIKHVVIPDIEFISSALVWRYRENDLRVSYVQTQKGHVSIDAVSKAFQDNTTILCMSGTQEVSGDYFSFETLYKHKGKGQNEYWVVDGIQEAGILVRDFEKEKIDAYVVGGHKWLGSPFGLGFMYISDRLLKVLKPNYYGYFNLCEPSIGWTAYLESRNRKLDDSFEHLQEAKSFESGGMINGFGALSLQNAFYQWESYGVKRSKEEIRKKNKFLRSEIEQLKDWSTLGSSQSKHLSGICTLSHIKGIDEERKYLQQLRKASIMTSLRSIQGIGGIGISIHYKPTKDELKEMINILKN